MGPGGGTREGESGRERRPTTIGDGDGGGESRDDGDAMLGEGRDQDEVWSG